MEGTEEGTAWYKMAQDASRHFYNTLMFQKCVGVCSGELEIGGEGAGEHGRAEETLPEIPIG